MTTRKLNKAKVDGERGTLVEQRRRKVQTNSIKGEKLEGLAFHVPTGSTNTGFFFSRKEKEVREVLHLWRAFRKSRRRGKTLEGRLCGSPGGAITQDKAAVTCKRCLRILGGPPAKTRTRKDRDLLDRIASRKVVNVPDFRPDWVACWTAQEGATQLDLKFKGPGWYLTGADCILVCPYFLDERNFPKEAITWMQRGWHRNQVFCFLIWNDRTPFDALNAMVNAPTRVDESEIRRTVRRTVRG